MVFKRFLQLLCILLPSASMAFGARTTAPSGMNVVFIAIDDMTTTAGFMSEWPGNFLQTIYPDSAKRAAIRQVLTPNIDRLAQEGIAFMNAQCAGPVCNPSRTALLTGIRPHVSGILSNGDGEFRKRNKNVTVNGQTINVRNAITLPQNLKNQGFYTAGCGKIYHGSADTSKSWTDWFNPGGQNNASVISPWSPEKVEKNPVMKFGYHTKRTSEWKDYQRAHKIATILEQGDIPAGKPFFLACGIFRPHLPLYCPKELVDLFKSEDIQVSRALLNAIKDDLKDTGRSTSGGRFHDWLKAGLKINSQDGDIKTWREGIRYYLGCCALADRAVGRLLDGLNKSVYRDNTMVVLWSDHGWHLGEKYHVTKMTLYEESDNTLLVIKDPTHPETAGRLCNRPMSLMDLYRTISAKVGASVPDYVAGLDISPLLADPDRTWDSAALTSYGKRHALRTEHYRYIREGNAFSSSNCELYDMLSDADQINNLARLAEYLPVGQELDSRLNAALVGEPLPPASTPTIQAHAALYPFEGDVKDSFGNRHGTAMGLTYASGMGGTQGAHFNGEGAYLRVPNWLKESFTVGVWMRTTSTGQTGRRGGAVPLLDASGNNTVTGLHVSLGGGRLQIRFGTSVSASSIDPVNDNQWHHVAVVRDQATRQISFYLDGVLKAQGTGPSGAQPGTAFYDVGGRPGESSTYSGDLDELRLYDEAWDANEVVNLLTVPAPTPEPEKEPETGRRR